MSTYVMPSFHAPPKWRGMEIKNETDWQTRDLRKVFAAVAAEVRKKEGALRWRLKIRIVPARYAERYSGYAYYHSGTILLRLPRSKHGPLNTFTLAGLFEHELAHCYGYRHKTMGRLNHSTYWVEEFYPYLRGVVVQAIAAKPKPSRDERRAGELVRLQDRLVKWEAKERRAKKAAAKLRQQIRRRERAAA